MAVSINNKNGTTTTVARNVSIIKQPANRFLTKAVYDPNGEVAQAGGIPEYVDSQVSEISEVVNIHEERRNIFDYTDVTDNKYRASALGSSINDTVDKANGWYSNQIWEVKKGDTIYQSTRWFPLLIYNESGILVEYRTSGDTGGVYTITNDNAKYLTIQASAHTDEYLGKLMLSINEPLPAEYVPYTDVRTVSQFDAVEEKIPTDGRAILNKGFVILTFDAFNSVDDARFDIVNEYGFKANVACTYGVSWKDICTKVQKQGWDSHLYSGHNWPTNDSYYVDNPSAEVQAVWDSYVKEEVDYALTQGVSNPTAWGCRQGKSCDGLENACKKYGIKMIRGGAKATKFTEKFSYATSAPTGLYASSTQSCINAFTAAANIGYGVVFTTHGIYETTEQADANYGMTETTLRQFLSALKVLVDEGKLEVLTFREVYQKYYQNDALHNNYDRLAYRAFGTNLPVGGTTGQVLIKSSNADYDTEWGDGVLNTKYSNDISKITLWKNGTIDYKGQSVSGNTRLKNSQYLDVTDGLVIHINDENYEYGICLYSDIDTQIETEKFYFDANTNTNVKYVVYYQRDVTGAELLEAFPSLKYIKVLMRNVQSETTISPSDYDKITLDYQNDTYSLITYLDKISKIITESSGFIKIKNTINSLAAIWAKWNGRLAFGMDTSKANVPLEVDGQIYAEGTIIAHNGGTQATNRWSAHIFEGYSKDNYSRMTMLLDKHPAEVNGKPSLEYYLYTGVGHRASDYGNTKIGSDAQYHSFFFNRDEFICVGLADFRFPITLWRVDPSGLNRNYSTVEDLDAHVDAETQAGEHLSSLRYIYLKNAENGTMFYDTARNKVVCKINGAWCDLAYTDASSNYSYL